MNSRAFVLLSVIAVAACVTEERQEIARANVLYNQGEKDPNKLEQALRIYRRVTEKNPRSAEAQIAFGQVLFDLGCYNRALERFDASLEAAPDAKPGLFGRGASLMFLKRWDDAAATYRRALINDERNLVYANNLGKAFFYKGDLAEAETTFKKVLIESADDRTARFFLGEIAIKQNRPEAATEHFLKLTKLEPTKFYGYFGLAKVALIAGRTEDGLEKLRAAFEKGIDDVAGVRADPVVQRLLEDARVKRWLADASKRKGAITDRTFRAAPVCEVVLPKAT